MKQKTEKYAVTGGIGSGKSYLLSRLADAGFPVYSCDEINRKLLARPDILAAIRAYFPECMRGGAPDKKLLSDLIYADADARAALERILHPAIMRELMPRMTEHPVSFAEVPLLYEGGYEKMFDHVIAVVRNEEERVRAVMQRDGLTEEEVRARMRSQLPVRQLKEKGCILLENDGTPAFDERISALIAQIRQNTPQ